MFTNISHYNVVKLTAVYGVQGTSAWVDLTATADDGGTFLQTFFFDSAHVARAYADAINNAVPIRLGGGGSGGTTDIASALPLQRVCGND